MRYIVIVLALISACGDDASGSGRYAMAPGARLTVSRFTAVDGIPFK